MTVDDQLEDPAELLKPEEHAIQSALLSWNSDDDALSARKVPAGHIAHKALPVTDA